MRFVKSLEETQYTGKSSKCNVNTCRLSASWPLIGESRNMERSEWLLTSGIRMEHPDPASKHSP